MNKKFGSFKQGFTFGKFIFIIVGIAVLLSVLLAGVVYFSPKEQTNRLKAINKAKRTEDVQKILDAIHAYSVEKKGLPSGLEPGMPEVQIGVSSMDCSISTGGCSVMMGKCFDGAYYLSKYLPAMPKDPEGGTEDRTKYAVGIDQQGVVTVKACAGDRLDPVSASR